jgi:hypothetical protein
MKRILVCLILAALCGCSTTVAVPEVKEALKCDVSPSLLATCGSPAEIRQGITFGEMIDVSRRDRDALRECALRQQGLTRAVAACSDNIERYNAQIRAINASNAGKQ